MGLAFTTSVSAQLPPDVRDRLAERSVVATGSFVYAKAAGSVRGTREASESFYLVRGSGADQHPDAVNFSTWLVEQAHRYK